jgi:hypothetical protein
MARPQSIIEIARRALSRSQGFDAACRELLDEWQSMDDRKKSAALAEEPASIDPVRDAYLAALAEHLALSARLVPPAWSEAPQRFLAEPFFSGGLESLKAILLAESPLAFRRRLIFISADGLSRPNRQFVEETIPGA